MGHSSFQCQGLGPRRQLQPPRGKPHIYRSKGRWIVRVYDPILKGARAFKFRNFNVACASAKLWREQP